jgi:hypothetical protein
MRCGLATRSGTAARQFGSAASASGRAALSDVPSHERREHDLTIHVFSISAALVGVCLTGIGILRLVAAQTKVQTLGDEFLAADAVLLVVVCFLSFWSFKTGKASYRQKLRLIVDLLFMLALVVMVGVCAIIAYAIV